MSEIQISENKIIFQKFSECVNFLKSKTRIAQQNINLCHKFHAEIFADNIEI